MIDERIPIADGANVIHLHGPNSREDSFTIWLNTDVADFDGLCIGTGESRAEAVEDAIQVLEDGVRALRGEK